MSHARAATAAGHDPRPDPGPTVLLVGQPNVGKSVFFNLLTGRYTTVSNYPGTTVEVARGAGRAGLIGSTIIDTPGIHSLTPLSDDEQVTRDLLIEEPLAAVAQIGDARNLVRTLMLSLQLAEAELPFLLVLNMQDEARADGVRVRCDALSRQLGVPVMPTAAVHREGTDEVAGSLGKGRRSTCRFRYSDAVERGVAEATPLLPDSRMSRRCLALMALCGDASRGGWLTRRLPEQARRALARIRSRVEAEIGEPLIFHLNRRRLELAEAMAATATEKHGARQGRWARRLDHWALHPVWGLPILAVVLYSMYLFVGVFGAGTAVDFLENVVFGRYLNVWAAAAVGWAAPWAWVRDLLVGEYGVITMAVTYAMALVLPIVGTFFIAFGILEDSGYLPRLAILSNRMFRAIGLNGKAVLPMVLGLGCDTMATLTTRILETRKERTIVILLLALGVPCSAQLAVILALLSTLSWKAMAVWVGITGGVILMAGWLASRFIAGRGGDFILELPPLRRPRLANVAAKTLARMEWYLREAVPLFILGTLLLFALDRLGALAATSRFVAPVVTGWMGLPEQATAAFLIGFLRRDFGAAGLYQMAGNGDLNPSQVLVSVVAITLFMPCVAQFFMVIREQGLRVALAVAGVVLPTAIGVAGLLHRVLQAVGGIS
jgi:ferrous iron transport protein B